MGSAFLRSNLKRIKKRLDHAEHGGALLLGVNGICVIGHGSSKALSVVIIAIFSSFLISNISLKTCS